MELTMKWTHPLLLTAAILLGPSLTGCSTQARKVDCDGTLRPINRPAPAPAAPSETSQSSNEKPSHEK
jgi:hypothetical protein